ncbi:MAG: DNA polymerase III subunit beta [Candidatus Microgenomates bacterium]
MKINKDVFLDKLNLATKFTANRISGTDALQGVYLQKQKNTLNFYSTNLNYYFRSTIQAKDEENFDIVIEPKKIIEFLSLLLPGDIDIKIKEKSLIVSQEKSKGEFPIISVKDFPLLKNQTDTKKKINIKILKEVYPLISFAASTNETRPVLTGINFVSLDEETQIVATDGFRLSIYSLKTKPPITSVIIPNSFLSEVLRLSTKDEIDFSYNEKEKVITFYIEDNELSSRLIEGEYPPYERVIPKEAQTKVVVDKDEFLRNIKLVSVFARDYSNIILFDVEKEGIKISPKTGLKEENTSFQDAQIEGQPIKIAFNSKFLIDFLSKTNAEKILIELLRPDSPTVFKINGNNDFLHIIMPVRIQE